MHFFGTGVGIVALILGIAILSPMIAILGIMIHRRFFIHAQLLGLDQLLLVRGQKEKRPVGRARQAGNDYITLNLGRYFTGTHGRVKADNKKPR